MRKLHWTKTFRKDVKRLEKRNYRLQKLFDVMRALETNTSLPDIARPHLLKGEWIGKWECHMAPDWILIYDIQESNVDLLRTGTHADLFE